LHSDVSDHVSRCQPAGAIAVGQLDLQRGVTDPEFMVELFGDAVEEIVARVSTRHDERRGQRGFGRAHPRIQVMPRPHAQDATPTVAAMRRRMTT
jgi:hypothetical protein